MSDANYVYTVTVEYFDGSYFEEKLVWAGDDRTCAVEFARQRCLTYATPPEHAHYSRCVVTTWQDGVPVSSQTLLAPGCTLCPHCDGRGMVRPIPNNSYECKSCLGIGILPPSSKEQP